MRISIKNIWKNFKYLIAFMNLRKSQNRQLFANQNSSVILGVFVICISLYGCFIFKSKNEKELPPFFLNTQGKMNFQGRVKKVEKIVTTKRDTFHLEEIEFYFFDKNRRISEVFYGETSTNQPLNLIEKNIYTDTTVEQLSFIDGIHDFSVIQIIDKRNKLMFEIYDSAGVKRDTTLKYKLDNSLNVIRVSKFKDFSTDEFFFSYNKFGQVKEYGDIYKGHKNIEKRMEYDNNRCLVNVNQYLWDYPNVIEFKRDKNCNELEYVAKDKEGKVGDKLIYLYEFDSIGNWTKKIEINAFTSDTLKIEMREIEYYK